MILVDRPSLNEYLRLRIKAMGHGGMMEISRKTGIAREHLHKILSPEGNPTLDTLLKLLLAMNLEMRLVPGAFYRSVEADSLSPPKTK